MADPRLTRAELLGGAAASLALLAGCSSGVPRAAKMTSTGSLPPDGFRLHAAPDEVDAVSGDSLGLAWETAAGADRYDLELNGLLVGRDLVGERFDIAFGDRSVPFQEGPNAWRVRARNAAGARWSDRGTFDVRPVAGIRQRCFDLEESGPLEPVLPSRGTTIEVSDERAFADRGKALRLRCSDRTDTRAYVDLTQLPVAQCWLRLAIWPEEWERDQVSVSVAAIRSAEAHSSERLIWETGRELRTTSLQAGVQLPENAWFQVQLGVLEDGAVELWAFDGAREFFVGRGLNEHLAGQVKDGISLGNHSPNDRIRYEVWLDEVAVGERRLPWARPADRCAAPRLRRLVPAELPRTFSFVFGSCNNASRLPNRAHALEAAADANPDFVVHLGDCGYADVNGYTQSTAGYLAFWADLFYEEQLARLARKPWIYVASDHDLGGNDVDEDSVTRFAAAALHQWRSNDSTVDAQGRYGRLDLDGGRVLLVWLDTVAFRSPLSAPDSFTKTMLGATQKRWLLRTLDQTGAGLVIIAAQAPIGHDSPSGWARYPIERSEIVAACLRATAQVRWLSADHHSARWARLGENLVEWGAAPLNNSVEPLLPASELAEESVTLPEAGGDLGRLDLRRFTSFGRVSVDTERTVATFEIRDAEGRVRELPSGFRMHETVRYA